MTVYCPFLDCHEKVHINKVMAHIQGKNHNYGHRVYNLHNNGTSWNFRPDEKYKTGVQPKIDFDNRHFFLELSRTPSGTWHSWVYFSGFKEEAAKYMAVIKISVPGGKRSLTYVGEVFPMDIEREIIEKNHNVFMFNDTFIRPAVMGWSLELVCTCTIEKM
jgi:hypothetical protein